MALPVPKTVSALAFARAPSVPTNPNATEGPLVCAANVTVTWATTPLAIVLAFGPEARHMSEPLLLAHDRVFPAAFRAAPAELVITDTSPGAYWRFHCAAAGANPGEAFSDSARETEPP